MALIKNVYSQACYCPIWNKEKKKEKKQLNKRKEQKETTHHKEKKVAIAQ